MPRKKRPTPPGKTRTREHVIADLAINHLERRVLLCGYTVERVRHDYGHDLMLTTYDEQGRVEGGVVFFQVKATDHVRLVKNGRVISWTISRRDLRLWLRDAYPVILVVYDGEKDKAVWFNVQAYFTDHSTPELFAGGETLNVHIPVSNRLDRRAIRTFRRYKELMLRPTTRRLDDHD